MSNQSPERTREVTVLVDDKPRRFTLKRFTIQRAIDHLRIQEQAWNAGEQTREEIVGNPLSLTLSSQAYLKTIAPQVVSLLCFPADDAEPLTEEEFWQLDPDDPSNVLAIQEELSSLRELILNGKLILQEAEEKMASEIQEAIELPHQIEKKEA